MPEVSVITINYNDAAGLEKTIKSVVSQNTESLEFIVIDGGSTDNSAGVIEKYASKITRWVSEKDKGIYDAQNKGVHLATGEFLIFLNSGDSFASDDVVRRFLEFQKTTPAKVYFGNTNVIDAGGSSTTLVPPSKPDLNFWYASTINHQAVFMQAALFKDYGNFSTENKYASDFEHLFRIFVKEPAAFAHFNHTVCNYDNTGLTSKDEYHQLLIAERIRIIKKYVTRKQFSEMRREYLKTLPLKRKLMVVIREKPLLKALLKPFYKLFFN